MAKSSVSLKLLIDTKGKRVLFAEASKECVDFLFHILSLPVANLISLLKKQGIVGALANLYESIENLDDSYYIVPKQSKEKLLTPVYLASGSSFPLLAIKNEPCEPSVKKTFYRCSRCNSYVSDCPSVRCPKCFLMMTVNLTYVAPPAAKHKSTSEGGYVKGMITYMVMDDLRVIPMSTISSITLLSQFNVKDVGVLKEEVVNVGMDEAMMLLNSSLQSKMVLTDVFLKSSSNKKRRSSKANLD